MDEETGRALDKIRRRLRRFMVAIVRYVIKNDPNLDEKARLRVTKLPIYDWESDDFTPEIGQFVLQNLMKIRKEWDEEKCRKVYRPKMIKSLTPFGFRFNFWTQMNFRCPEFFMPKGPMHYLNFLTHICDFCSKIAEVEYSDGFCFDLLIDVQWHMYHFRHAFPGYEVIKDFVTAELQKTPDNQDLHNDGPDNNDLEATS